MFLEAGGGGGGVAATFSGQKRPNQCVKMLILAFINQNLSIQQKVNRNRVQQRAEINFHDLLKY